VPGEGEVRAELIQLFEISLSTTRIDPLLEGLRPSSPDFAALRSTRDGDYNGTIVVPLLPMVLRLQWLANFIFSTYVLRAVLTPRS